MLPFLQRYLYKQQSLRGSKSAGSPRCDQARRVRIRLLTKRGQEQGLTLSPAALVAASLVPGGYHVSIGDAVSAPPLSGPLTPRNAR